MTADVSTGAGAGEPALAPDVAEDLADVMFALAAPSRLQILACLSGGPRAVGEIVAAVAMEQSAVSHQLRVLREHGIVSVERRGRHRLYALRTRHVGEALAGARAHVDEVRGRRGADAERRAG